MAPDSGEVSNAQCWVMSTVCHCSGYYVLITSVTLRKYGGKVQAGDQIGVAGNIECNLDNMQQSNQNYLRVELFREGKPIDPTHHLVDC